MRTCLGLLAATRILPKDPLGDPLLVHTVLQARLRNAGGSVVGSRRIPITVDDVDPVARFGTATGIFKGGIAG